MSGFGWYISVWEAEDEPGQLHLEGGPPSKTLSYSLLNSCHNQHPVAWNSRGTSNASWHILILPKASVVALSCTPSDISLPRSTRCLVRHRNSQQQYLKIHVFHEQFGSLYSECPFIYNGKKKEHLLPSPRKCCSQVIHHCVRKSNNYSPDRGMTLFAEMLYT